jgi:hypothetical protein
LKGLNLANLDSKPDGLVPGRRGVRAAANTFRAGIRLRRLANLVTQNIDDRISAGVVKVPA